MSTIKEIIEEKNGKTPQPERPPSRVTPLEPKTKIENTRRARRPQPIEEKK